MLYNILQTESCYKFLNFTPPRLQYRVYKFKHFDNFSAFGVSLESSA